MKTVPANLIEAIRHYSDPDVCLDFMVSLRWPNGVACPTCGSMDVIFISTRRVWKCKSKHTRQQFSVKVGTIFEDSPIGLNKWLVAVWLLASAKNGISSYEVGRAIGVTQKTAWFMMHRIRLAMQDDAANPFSGEVEADETFIGGKARFMHKSRWQAVAPGGRGAVGKAAVLGLLERHGPDGHSAVRAKMVPNTRRRSLSPEVRKHVIPGSTVYTDALRSYEDLADHYIHEVIDHAEEYVRGAIHTNGIENFWSLVKRAIKGTYVSVEPYHLFRYLDEEAFRFNSRKAEDADRFCTVVSGVTGKRLRYNELTGS